VDDGAPDGAALLVVVQRRAGLVHRHETTDVGPDAALGDQPEEIGVHLTESYMMDPEASVSALVFHHPEARYFVISPGDLEAFERRLAVSA